MNIKICLTVDDQSLEEYDNYYEKEIGFSIDDFGEISYEVDSNFVLREGQRIACKFGMMIVKWSYLDIDKNYQCIRVGSEE